MSAEDDHVLREMICMYDTLCTQLRTLKEDARIVGVYALYDCVSLILARMLNPRLLHYSYNATRLQATTDTIHTDVLNRMFLDFDKDFYGTFYYDAAMDTVGFDACEKKLFWRKVKEYLVSRSPSSQPVVSEEKIVEEDMNSNRSFDPESQHYSKMKGKSSPSASVKSESSIDGDFDPMEWGNDSRREGRMVSA